MENGLPQLGDAGPVAVEAMPPAASATPDDDLIEIESLVEEVSIDGMCGVY